MGTLMPALLKAAVQEVLNFVKLPGGSLLGVAIEHLFRRSGRRGGVTTPSKSRAGEKNPPPPGKRGGRCALIRLWGGGGEGGGALPSISLSGYARVAGARGLIGGV